MSDRWRWIFGFVLMPWCAVLFGDSPQLKYLQPAGMQRGATTKVVCHGEFSWPTQVWAPTANVKRLEQKGELEIYVPKDYPGDRIWLRLYNDDGVSQALPLMIGSLPETNEIEPNDSIAQPQTMSEFAKPPRDAEVVINGVLQERGDVDCFAVELKQGQTLVAAVEANEAFGSPLDGILQIVDPDGTTLAENHDSVGLDPRLVFTSPEDGQYIVRMFAFPAQPNQQIRFHGGADYLYRLTLTTGPFITHAVPNAVSDCDRKQGYLAPQGWNIPPGVLLKTVLSEHLSLTKQACLRMPGWSGVALLPRVKSMPSHDAPATVRTQPLEVTLPTSYTGVVKDADSKHYFRIPMKQSQRMRIAVEAIEYYSPLCPQIRLLGPDGKVVVESPERGALQDVDLTSTAKQDGDHLLILSDRFGHGGNRHFYHLALTEPKSDFQLTLDTDTLQVTGTAELTVNVQRQTGVGEPVGDITVSAVDLPPEVTVESVVSQPEGDTSKKVTLKFASTISEPQTQRIRIRGEAKDKSRWATTPQKLRHRFEHLWLLLKPGNQKAPAGQESTTQLPD